MKKILLSLVLAFSCSFSLVAQELYKEGEHYKIISKEASSEPEVLEFFSYWCPHCYNFEPIVAEVKKKLDSDVTFKKVHVNFMGFTSAKIQDEATSAMLAARLLKKEEEMTAAIFKQIHVNRRPITGLSDLKDLLISAGIEGDKLEKTAKSFGVKSLLTRNNDTIKKYRKDISGVPNFIVNGKYQATFARGMSPDEMVDLIVWLSKQS
jgi:thiol:disulfide interchange protein DsbA